MIKMVILLLVLPLASLAGGHPGPELPTHPDQQPLQTVAGPFPRCTPAELAAGGYPDHMHRYWWSSWQIKTDADGQAYGPGAFCTGKQNLEYPGTAVKDGRTSYRNFVALHNPAYRECDFLAMMELLDWADHEVGPQLGLTATDTLVVISPDNIDAYRTMSGQQTWRLFKTVGDTCIIEPYGTLQARTLDGHGLFMVYTDWLLSENFGDDLPVWLHAGLTEYMSENGVHLANFMNEFRPEGPILFSAPLINTILGQGPDADLDRDREMFRRASYSAFLMAWELVENRGGLPALRDFFDLLQAGIDLDAAAVDIYGLDMKDLARSLDSVKLGEPIGSAIATRAPHKKP